DRAEDTGATRVAVVLQNDGGVLVEADVRAVRTAALLDGANDDRLDDVTLLHVATGDRVLDGGDNDVTDARVAATGATEHTDAKDLLRTSVVGDTQSRLLLDHVYLLVVCRFPGRGREGTAPAPSLAERCLGGPPR